MGSLTEFLNRQAEIQRASKDSMLSLRQEWTAESNRVVNQIGEWLHEADSAKVLDIQDDWVSRREEGMGGYTVKALKVYLGAREVQVIPIARFVAGVPLPSVRHRVDGRIDITDGATRYSLYRVMDCPEGRWILAGERKPPEEFTREAVEEAIQDLLS